MQLPTRKRFRIAERYQYRREHPAGQKRVRETDPCLGNRKAPAEGPSMTEAISLIDAMPKRVEEKRDPLVPGMEPFYLKDIFITEDTQYGKLAKINGFKIIGPHGETIPLKYRTTSAPLVGQFEDLIAGPACKNGRFPIPIGPVTISTEMTSKGNEKYVLVPAAMTSKGNEKYVLVPAAHNL
jgi:hypothetical protein